MTPIAPGNFSIEPRYHVIEPNARIVYDYDVWVRGRHHSVSLATVELEPRKAQTRLLFTEQVAFLDGTTRADGTASRDRGTAAHLDRLRRVLRS